MNDRFMAEVAAVASAHSEHVIAGPVPLPESSLQAFWFHGRKQVHEWLGRLNGLVTQLDKTLPERRRHLWLSTERVLQEICASEILIRVWSAILVASDRHKRTLQAEPIARNLLISSMKARHLAFSILLEDADLSLPELSRVDRLRRKTERWTDLLLGHLVLRYELPDFAFDERRARTFGEEHWADGQLNPNNRAWDLILAGLRLVFPLSASPALLPEEGCSSHSLCLIRSILASFPRDAFRDEGPFRSLIDLRLRRSGLHSESVPPADFHGCPTLGNQSAKAAARQGVHFSKLRRKFHDGRS